ARRVSRGSDPQLPLTDLACEALRVLAGGALLGKAPDKRQARALRLALIRFRHRDAVARDPATRYFFRKPSQAPAHNLSTAAASVLALGVTRRIRSAELARVAA